MFGEFMESDNRKPLEKYARNLTKLASENKLEPVINRDSEIREIIRILSRKTKNNPILVGDPGVGKTALVEGLARKIVEKQVPIDLLDKQVYEIDFTSIIAGASFQGQFEKRLKALLKQIEDAKGQIIVFIDEIHVLVGAGKNSQANGMDAANIIKPMLARGQMHLIGATTFNEYKKYIEADPALERRMQKIKIDESTVEDTITILRGIKDRFETYHKVAIEDQALVTAAKMSERYISDRFLPDKAIDLVDEAAASIKVSLNYEPTALIEVKERRARLEIEKFAIKNEKDQASIKRFQEVQKELKNVLKEEEKVRHKWHLAKDKMDNLAKKQDQLYRLNHQSDQFYNEGSYEKAAKIRYQKLPQVQKEIEKLEQEVASDEDSILPNKVTKDTILEIISKWTSIPVTKLISNEREQILNLKKELKKHIKGQDSALEEINNTILRSKADIHDPNKPIGSFLFLGPTGVGKTEVALVLADLLFGSRDNLIRLDMSEFLEKHSVSKIIGSPPGYIGFESGGQLTEKIRNRPYSILLLDEIEKAHPDVMNIWLQILDTGRVTDAKGRIINCRNLIVIMTSNLADITSLNEETIESQPLVNTLQAFLKPEFINRIDSIVTFNSLDNESRFEIAKLELAKFTNRLKAQNYQIGFNNSVINMIVERGFNKSFGARPIKRFIQDKIETLVATEILRGNLMHDVFYNLTNEAGIFKLQKTLTN